VQTKRSPTGVVMGRIAESDNENSVTGLLVDEGSVLESCGIEIFDGLPDGEFEAIVAEVPLIDVAKGTVFYASEDGPSDLYLLRSGRVELYRQSASGKRLTLGIISEGAFFGEMSLLGDVQAGTGAVAFEASVVHVMSREYVRALMLQHPTVAVRVVDVLARRLQRARESLQEMVFNDVTGRVAGLLLLLDPDDVGFVESYSHQELANMVG
jgi:CRP-like cAMP-binding protein